jgi:DNA polymerase III delta prime subunit
VGLQPDARAHSIVPADDPIGEFRTRLKAVVPPFSLPRRFVAGESWTKATTQDGIRYLGLFREHEPDLAAILVHPWLLILGEPGVGKSTTGHAIVRHVLDKEPPTALPVIASLKSYSANLRRLLLAAAPEAVIDAQGMARTYILDGIDEVSSEHRAALHQELNQLLRTDASARLILTSRQAFAAQHPDAFPAGLTTYHLLDFDDDDINACTTHHSINIDEFRQAVRDAECEEEIRNPFVLTVMLERYKTNGSLSRLRSDNVGYVVHRLIESRPLFNATRQQRALRMLAVTCETAARNELTQDEALRVLLEAIECPPETAQQLLDELSQSILIRTAGGISFQMRSYGEYLAAEELHDKPVDRLKELAFIGDIPIDTWQNTVTYLAEMNDKVRAYFAHYYPEWLINVSPSALNL